MKGRKEEQESGNGRSLNVLWNSSLLSSVFWGLTVSQNRNHGNRQLQHYIFKALQPEMLGKKTQGTIIIGQSWVTCFFPDHLLHEDCVLWSSSHWG